MNQASTLNLDTIRLYLKSSACLQTYACQTGSKWQCNNKMTRKWMTCQTCIGKRGSSSSNLLGWTDLIRLTSFRTAANLNSAERFVLAQHNCLSRVQINWGNWGLIESTVGVMIWLLLLIADSRQCFKVWKPSDCNKLALPFSLSMWMVSLL